jgi:SAM-dependent methyltransferase
MKKKLLQYLECLSCQGEICLETVAERDGDEVLEGNLQCVLCGRRFPIVRGVPRFVDLAEVDEEKAATAFSFGWEWQHFSQQDEQYADQLLGWLNPVRPDFFKDKVVLDGGCGKGRHSLLAAEWGARDVIGIDLSDAVETAFAATRGYDNVHIVQGDICRPPFVRAFDYAFSLGVLDHLSDPRLGFNSLASKIKPGGYFSVWAYGAENNRWITQFVTPVRVHFTSRVSPRTLLHLSKLPTAIVYLATKLVYGPLKKVGKESIARRLFYGEYLTSLSRFGWREQHSIVFDHLVAPTAQYFPRQEFEQLWEGIHARDTVIGWHNKNSWRGFGRMTDFQVEV